MKAYFEYEDGGLFTANGNKYHDFYPENLLKAETEQKEPDRPSSRKGSSRFRITTACLRTTACEQTN